MNDVISPNLFFPVINTNAPRRLLQYLRIRVIHSEKRHMVPDMNFLSSIEVFIHPD